MTKSFTCSFIFHYFASYVDENKERSYKFFDVPNWLYCQFHTKITLHSLTFLRYFLLKVALLKNLCHLINLSIPFLNKIFTSKLAYVFSFSNIRVILRRSNTTSYHKIINNYLHLNITFYILFCSKICFF